MTLDPPNGAELLAEARRMLLDRLLDALPVEHRYAARMVANAMAIAARELDAGDAPARAALERAAALYGEPVVSAGELALIEAELEGFDRRLAADIRNGAFDKPGERQRALLHHLWATTVARVKLSNPRTLSGYAGADAPSPQPSPAEREREGPATAGG